MGGALKGLCEECSRHRLKAPNLGNPAVRSLKLLWGRSHDIRAALVDLSPQIKQGVFGFIRNPSFLSRLDEDPVLAEYSRSRPRHRGKLSNRASRPSMKPSMLARFADATAWKCDTVM
jgi:hypothetical protein